MQRSLDMLLPMNGEKTDEAAKYSKAAAERIEPSHISEVMKNICISPTSKLFIDTGNDCSRTARFYFGYTSTFWNETRGRKKKYTFYHLQKGEIQKINVQLKRARSIQTAMKRAANKEGVKITIQNHGIYLLIKRTK